MFNFIEGSEEIIHKVLSDTLASLSSSDCPIHNVKIIGSSDDVPDALFGQWVWRIMVS